MKLYNLCFFRTDETVNDNTIGRATFDIDKTQIESFCQLAECFYIYTLEKHIKQGNSIIMNLTIVKIHHSQAKTLLPVLLRIV